MAGKPVSQFYIICNTHCQHQAKVPQPAKVSRISSISRDIKPKLEPCRPKVEASWELPHCLTNGWTTRSTIQMFREYVAFTRGEKTTESKHRLTIRKEPDDKTNDESTKVENHHKQTALIRKAAVQRHWLRWWTFTINLKQSKKKQLWYITGNDFTKCKFITIYKSGLIFNFSK